MLTARPRHLFSRDWIFYNQSHRIGRLTIPWSKILIDLGRGDLEIDGEAYELTFPRLEADFSGHKEIGIKLFEKGEKTPLAIFSPKSSEQFSEGGLLEWKHRGLVLQVFGWGDYRVLDKKDDSEVGTIRFRHFLSRVRRIDLPDEIPRAVQVLLFAGTVLRTNR